MAAREPADPALPPAQRRRLSVYLSLTCLSVLKKMAGRFPSRTKQDEVISETRPPVCRARLTLAESAGVTEGFQMKI